MIAGLVALLASAPGSPADVLVLSHQSIAQYAEVLSGVREAKVGKLREADIGDEPAVQAALGQNPQVIIAVGSKAFDLAKAKGGGAVVIGAAVLNPATDGRTNVTAVPMEPRASDVLNTLKQLGPRARRVLALYPRAGSPIYLKEAKSAAQQSELSIDFVPLADLDGFQDTFREALKGHDAVWLMPDARLAQPELVKFMVSQCIERRTILIGFLDGMTRAGALASVSANFGAIGREAAFMAVELAGHPKDPASFRFAEGQVTVNQRTRQALDLDGALPAGAKVIK